MCGRFFLISQGRELASYFRLEEVPYIEPRYNIAPTQNIAVVRQNIEHHHFRVMSYMRWGLIPSWTKDMSKLPTLINARIESVQEKPAFRAAFRRRHCAIPANGFFEWSKKGAAKQPYVVQLKQRRLLAFAGLWESWQSPDGEIIESCAILTTAANEIVRSIHDRMPVILGHDGIDLWLEASSKDQEVIWHEFFRSPNSNDMEHYEVSTRVNNPKFDDLLCIEPIKISHNAQE